MKQFLILICWLCLISTASAQTPRLEFHHIGARDGDASLIIAIDTVDVPNILGKSFLDTAIILIDGQRSSGGKEVWRYVRDTVNALSPTLEKIDCIVLTHLHIDHYGGLPFIIEEASKTGWEIGKVLDRQFANYKNYFQPGDIPDACYDLSAPAPDNKSFTKYIQILKANNLYPTISPIPVNDVLKGLFNFKYRSMICVASSGATLATNPKAADTCFLPVVNASGKYLYKPTSENDMSIGFLIEFQGFHYLSLGDLGGVSGGGYTDGETPVTKWLQHAMGTGYHICANKGSHHGSEASTSPWFAATNNFTTSVIPASLRNYGKSENALPTETAIMNIRSIPQNTLLYMFVPKNPGTLASFWTKGNLSEYNEVILKIGGVPGYGTNVRMKAIQHAKSKQGVYSGPATVAAITCNKDHSDN